jgi:hypothetical protein
MGNLVVEYVDENGMVGEKHHAWNVHIHFVKTFSHVTLLLLLIYY